MTPGSRGTGGSLWRNWGLPLLSIVGLAAAVGFLVSKFSDVSFPLATAGPRAAFFGVVGYLLGVFKLYEVASARLGYTCEIRPAALPKSACADVEPGLLVIRERGGFPFPWTLEAHLDHCDEVRRLFAS